MNMLLHNIAHADIRQEDTLRRPQHKDDNGELKRYDRVLANPPFSQNYNDEQVANIVESKQYWIYQGLAEWRDLNATRLPRGAEPLA